MKKEFLIIGAVLVVIIVIWAVMNKSSNQIASDQDVATPKVSESTMMKEDSMMEGEEDSMMEESTMTANTYQVDTANSQLGWYAAKKIGNEHNGLVVISDGHLNTSEDGQPTGGEFTVNMSTITDENQQGAADSRVIKHLSSADFFEVDAYPESTFKINSITPAEGENGYTVTGDLTIKETTKEISFPAIINIDGDDLTASSEFTINRIDWGLIWGDDDFLSGLGDKILKDNIDFTINLVANK